MADLRSRDCRAPVRRHVRAADRRRRHAGRDLAAERLHRARRLRDGVRPQQQRPHRRRCARRRVRHAPDAADGQGDEPVDQQRAVRRVRPGAGRVGRRPCRRRAHGAGDVTGGRRGDAVVRPPGDRGARLRACRRAGAARRAAAGRPARGAGHRGRLRDPSGRRPHARSHERAARGGECPVRSAQGDGRDQSGVRTNRCRARDRRQRRHQPCCPLGHRRRRFTECRSSTSTRPPA